jgi:GDP-L-fucose synthase
MIDWTIHNETKEKIYNVTTGTKNLANLVNEKSEFRVLNDGLNNEYTSNNQRILAEILSLQLIKMLFQK